MKKMNNYVAPKAEVIELYTNKDLMVLDPGGQGNNNVIPGNVGTQSPASL